MVRIIGFLLVLVLFFGCDDTSKNKIDVSNVEVDFKVDRFEKKFYKASSSDLQKLKKEYAYMLGNVADSVSLKRINDKDEQFLFQQSDSVFGNFSEVKQDLVDLFKHIKYYNPSFKAPNVITYISNLDYDFPVIYADSLLFVSLDMYLGKNNIVYKSFPNYLSENYKKERIVVDVANDIITQSYPKFKNRTFLEKMINKGKYLYLLDAFLPSVSDDLKIGYSKEKLEWTQENEIEIWKYFIEKELLYSSDAKLNTRFLDNAPFSKFYLESDKESPGKIGVWVGWQIIRSYMKNNDVTLQQLIIKKPEEIYKKSKYKPRR